MGIDHFNMEVYGNSSLLTWRSMGTVHSLTCKSMEIDHFWTYF